MSHAFLAASPDGKRVFADGRLLRSELVRYDSRSRDFVPFLSGISAGDLDFSRDGQWVAYVSYPERTLWRSRIDGSERLQLTYPPVSASLPHWSPDGTRIAYDDREPGQLTKIFLISAQGETPQEVLSEKLSQADATWSADGKQLAFGRDFRSAQAGEKVSIQILDLNSKLVTTVPGSDNLFSPRWSPDGKHLAALSSDLKSLLIFDFPTQKWSDWVTEPGLVNYPAWSQDSSYVYYENEFKEDRSYHRVKVGQTHSEFLFATKDLKQFQGAGFGSWSGLGLDDSPLFVRDLSTDEIYSLDVELP